MRLSNRDTEQTSDSKPCAQTRDSDQDVDYDVHFRSLHVECDDDDDHVCDHEQRKNDQDELHKRFHDSPSKT